MFIVTRIRISISDLDLNLIIESHNENLKSLPSEYGCTTRAVHRRDAAYGAAGIRVQYPVVGRSRGVLRRREHLPVAVVAQPRALIGTAVDRHQLGER